MRGPDILIRTISEAAITDRYGNRWQYQSRSDHHSKIACWGILFDLLGTSGVIREQAAAGALVFGINHEMRDFKHNRKKDLDLVLARPRGAQRRKGEELTFRSLTKKHGIKLSPEEELQLNSLPALARGDVGSVLMALEAKACMTEHVKALPRLYDELNSSHETIHASAEDAVAIGFVMVNFAEHFLSPGRNKFDLRRRRPDISVHSQPGVSERVVEKIHEMPRRTKPGEQGFDALAIVVVDCGNDGSPVRLVERPPAPQPGDIYNYARMIQRAAQAFEARFRTI